MRPKCFICRDVSTQLVLFYEDSPEDSPGAFLCEKEACTVEFNLFLTEIGNTTK